ncbi:dermonecrotic toxin domain-containing protein [Pseudomonas sp. NPDC089554]|uniref:dermonecrotic toxin domain-containing protein n=1 Tax=Pseudomonas sp. NPDC089554 TaxID=3390653 RepID=UPI003D01A7B0
MLGPDQPQGSDRQIRIIDALRPPSEPGAQNHYVLSGFFRRTEPQRYDHETFVNLPVATLEAFTWQQDFANAYKATLDTYWNDHFDAYRQCLKLNFIAACNKQAAEGSLTREAVTLAWQVAGLQTPPAPLQARALNVYGYPATDLLCFRRKDSLLLLLYIPGNASPLHAFDSEAAMQDWFAEQCRDPARRAALEAHFNAADTPDGLSFSGLGTALNGLAAYPEPYRLDSDRPGFTTDGIWTPREYVNYKMKTYSPPLTGELFEALADRYRTRSYHDADFLIESDSAVTKARWAGYLSAAMTYLAPLALAVPALWPLFAAGGIAQFGLGLDRAINGKSMQEQAEGVKASAFGLLNALPVVQDLAQEKPLLFRFWQDRFVAPGHINDQLGYSLGPITPPHWPDPQVLALFDEPVTLAALPDANPDIARLVERTPLYTGQTDELRIAFIEGFQETACYDLVEDAFMRMEDLNEISPQYYCATPGADSLIPVPSDRVVTDATRMSSLRAMGIDLKLPFDLQLPDKQTLDPIPSQVMSFWVGDKVIRDDILRNIAQNSSRLEQSTFAYRLYLSRATPAAFEENLRLLGQHAPNLEVLALEEQPFYLAFTQSRYFDQFTAAMSGPGSNFASATDILRYQAILHEGGLYMDIDDAVLVAGEPITASQLSKSLDQLDLRAAADGLLLNPPMSNASMHMDCLYNNSLIGSHAGNPVLEAVSEEIHRRLLEAPDFYTQPRPLLEEDPVAFGEYALKLRDLTGPGVLSHVVDQRLPELAALRQVFNAMSMGTRQLFSVVDLARFRQALDQYLPLDQAVAVGGLKSWARA